MWLRIWEEPARDGKMSGDESFAAHSTSVMCSRHIQCGSTHEFKFSQRNPVGRDRGAGGHHLGGLPQALAPTSDQPAFSDLVQKVKHSEVDNVVINSSTGDITGHYKKGILRMSSTPPCPPATTTSTRC